MKDILSNNVYDKKWLEYYWRVQKYFLENNTNRIPFGYEAKDGYDLYVWIANQKIAYREGTLSPARALMLTELGISFERVRTRNPWDNSYEKVKEYYETYGNLKISKAYNEKCGQDLNAWLRRQNSLYLNNKLRKDRMDKLAELGFNFGNVYERQWDANLELVKEYYETYGNLNIPREYVTKQGVNLGMWFDHQKLEYRRGNLDSKRRQKLDELGFELENSNYGIEWDTVYKMAKKYFEEHGDLNVPRKYTTKDGYTLGRWINTQKTSFTNNKLSKSQINKLAKIGLDLSNMRHKKTWEESYQLAKEFYEEHGNLEVPANYKTPDGFVLRNWVNSQRVYYNDNKLSHDKIIMLQEIGMRFGKPEYIWLKHYNQVLQYLLDNGHLKMPRDYIDATGFNLGRWFYQQKRFYVSGKLRNSLREKLDELNIKELLDEEDIRVASRLHSEGFQEYYQKQIQEYNQKQEEKNNHINNHILALCEKLNISIEKNREVLKTLTLSEFRKRLIILQERNVLFCSEDGILHPIFSMSDDEIPFDNIINERDRTFIRTLKKDETPIE